MCGRFTSTATTDELMRRFGVTITQNLRLRWNVAPSQSSLVLIREGLHTQAMNAAWGFPHGDFRRPQRETVFSLMRGWKHCVKSQPFKTRFRCRAVLLWQAAGMNGPPRKRRGISSFWMAGLWRWQGYCFASPRKPDL